MTPSSINSAFLIRHLSQDELKVHQGVVLCYSLVVFQRSLSECWTPL